MEMMMMARSKSPENKVSKSFGLRPDMVNQILTIADREHIRSESELAGQMLQLVLNDPRLLKKAIDASAKKRGYIE